MDFKKSKRFLLILAAVYWVFAIGIYAIANEQFRYESINNETTTAEYVIGEVVDGSELQQEIITTASYIDSVELMVATYARENVGTLHLSLDKLDGTNVTNASLDIGTFSDNAYVTIPLQQLVSVEPGERMNLTLYTEGCEPGNAITLYAGRTLAGESALNPFCVNGESADGYLCVRVSGYNDRNFYMIYWIGVVAAFLLITLYTMRCWKAAQKGKTNFVVSLCTVYSRYSFLIKQLVSRDFKTKYKRSALGMAWSFMNPLLTMSVQYIVFSTLFRSDIPNYPVYLLIGIIFFTFFNEALTMGMTSITSNAALIKKVYMPKYIYPVSRILSSLVNFAFALMPLFLVMLITRSPFRVSMFLLIFDIACLLVFIIGMTLLLTTAMTFFQDTQFLWSVVSMMWQYMTPIFYPETIIPANILPIYRLNPMYQYISFARVCITEGVSPEPSAYIFCLAWALITLALGAFVFKKQQNKFVLYL